MSVHEFSRLKALVTLEQVNTTEGSKKEESFLEKLRRSCVVNFHYMQISLVVSMRLIFGDD